MLDGLVATLALTAQRTLRASGGAVAAEGVSAGKRSVLVAFLADTAAKLCAQSFYLVVVGGA